MGDTTIPFGVVLPANRRILGQFHNPVLRRAEIVGILYTENLNKINYYAKLLISINFP